MASTHRIAVSVVARTPNASLLRSGRDVASVAWWKQDLAHRKLREQRVARLDRARWRELRRETTLAQREQRTRIRFRHKRQSMLASLEERRATPPPSALLP